MGTSLIKFVKQACANCTGDPAEQCLGVDVFSKPFREPGACLIFQGQPCPYFERCVLGPPDYPYPHHLLAADPEFERRVREQYRQIDPAATKSSSDRKCPDCGVAILRPRQRFCDGCSNKRRLKTKRVYQRRYRRNNRS